MQRTGLDIKIQTALGITGVVSLFFLIEIGFLIFYVGLASMQIISALYLMANIKYIAKPYRYALVAYLICVAGVLFAAFSGVITMGALITIGALLALLYYAITVATTYYPFPKRRSRFLPNIEI